MAARDLNRFLSFVAEDASFDASREREAAGQGVGGVFRRCRSHDLVDAHERGAGDGRLFYFAVAGTPSATAFCTADARRPNAMIEAPRASTAPP
jgi:hypothetical protein